MTYMQKKQRGFTIIEMVIVIVVGGIIASVIAQFITRPMEGYIAQGRRAELVDIAETALGHISREVRLALPNSIRIACANQCVEIIKTLDGGRYRSKPPGDALKFTGTDSSFDTLGPLPAADAILNKIMVIYNTGQAGANAYYGDNTATITARALAADGVSDNITYSSTLPGNLFPFESVQHRFYVVETPISFICNPGANGTIYRYDNYTINPAQPVASPGGNSGLLASKVTSCSFEYIAGNPSRSGLLIARITISDSGESVTLLEQVHVVNQP